MCGNVGVAGNLTTKLKDTFRDLLVFDTLRGKDSTGVAGVGYGKDVSVVKNVGTPFELFDNTRYDGVVSIHKRAWLGHNRAATRGKVNRQNAHPFHHGNIVGTHNGTLDWWYRDVLPDAAYFDVDSEALIYALSQDGVQDTINKIQGAWALVWFDTERSTLNFLRNNLRPLYYSVNKAQDAIIWASEAGMLHCAMNRNQVEYEHVYHVPENIWMSLKIGTGGKQYLGDKFERLEVKEAPTRPPYQSTSSTTDTWARGTASKTGGTTTSSVPNTGSGSSPSTVAKGSNVPEATKQNVPFTLMDNQPGLFSPESPKSSSSGNVVELPNKSGEKPSGQCATARSFTKAELKRIRADAVAIIEKENLPKTSEVTEVVEQIAKRRAERRSPNESTPVGATAGRIPTNLARIYRDHKGNPITQTEFARRTGDGCSWCSTNVRWGEEVTFVGPLPQDHLCEQCSSDPAIVRELSTIDRTYKTNQGG